ncbi:MAG: hypothetical protein CM1200mP1_03030 [Candidatus Neomarinimicrobiota bacterium]|nr:MAG: hypothetical protein CM1200mP1_03030 [Candidatus Neomarinimicrobiota bacterium]
MKAEIDGSLPMNKKHNLNKINYRKKKRKAYRDSTKAVKIAVLGMTQDQVSAFDSNQEAREDPKLCLKNQKW